MVEIFNMKDCETFVKESLDQLEESFIDDYHSFKLKNGDQFVIYNVTYNEFCKLFLDEFFKNINSPQFTSNYYNEYCRVKDNIEVFGEFYDEKMIDDLKNNFYVQMYDNTYFKSLLNVHGSFDKLFN